MKNLSQIEAAAASLPPEQQRELLIWLSQRVGDSLPRAKSQSVAEIPAVSVGEVLSRNASGDLLDEMLEHRN